MVKRPNKIKAIIVSAGDGKRVGGYLPKQYLKIDGIPILAKTIQRFHEVDIIDEVIVVISQKHQKYFDKFILPIIQKEVVIILGGKTRRESVYEGLKHTGSEDLVLIHDGARPFITYELIIKIINGVKHFGAAAPGMKVTDSIWEKNNKVISGVQNRDNFLKAQTPQGFFTKDIIKNYEKVKKEPSDDVELAVNNGLRVRIVEGDEKNIKITTMNDIENINSTSKSFLKIRTGIGYDVHAFEAGNELILCGLKIPFNKSLKGHSDADVVMHAITDAIYGAIAEGDIGTWFPPNDIKWKNSNSEVFLKHANSLLTKKGYVISNLDCTIICEEPKIQPYTQKMRINMENILQITKDQISIKATTTEKLGFTGRKEGIAAQAIITVQKND